MMKLSTPLREKLISTRDILLADPTKPSTNAMWWYVDGLIDGVTDYKDVYVLLRWRSRLGRWAAKNKF